MDDVETGSRGRAALRAGLAWGLGWWVCSLAALAMLFLAGFAPPTATWAKIITLSMKFGFFGVLSGTFFSVASSLVLRRGRLERVGYARAGLLGAALTGFFVPTFLQAMNVVSGDGPVPMRFVLDDAAYAAVLGGVAAMAMVAWSRRNRAATGPSSRGP